MFKILQKNLHKITFVLYNVYKVKLNMENEKLTKPGKLNTITPIILLIVSLLILIIMVSFFIHNFYFFRGIVQVEYQDSEKAYKLQIFHLYQSFVKRGLGLFSGFSLIFIGTGISYYTSTKTKLEAQQGDLKFSLITASPGIVALVIGAILISVTIMSKDSFQYQSPQRIYQNVEEEG